MVQCEFDVEVASPPDAFEVSIAQPGRGFGQKVFEVEFAQPVSAFSVSIAQDPTFSVSISQAQQFTVSLPQPSTFTVLLPQPRRFNVTSIGSGGGSLTSAQEQKLNSIWSGATRDLNPGVVALCNFNIVTPGTEFTVEPADGTVALARGRIPKNAFTAGGLIRFFVTGSIGFNTTGTITAYFEHNDSVGANAAPIGVSHNISSGNFQLEAELTNNVLIFGNNGVQQLFAKFRAPNAAAVPTESIVQAQSFFNMLHFVGRKDAGGAEHELSDIGVAVKVTGAGGVLTVQMVYGEVHGLSSNRYTLRAPSQQPLPAVVNP